MKKAIATLMVMILLIGGCAKVEKVEKTEPVNVSRFMTVESTFLWRVVADRQTGVMYAVSLGTYNQDTFTLLVDAEGEPLIYEGWTE